MAKQEKTIDDWTPTSEQLFFFFFFFVLPDPSRVPIYRHHRVASRALFSNGDLDTSIIKLTWKPVRAVAGYIERSVFLVVVVFGTYRRSVRDTYPRIRNIGQGKKKK